MVSVLRDEPSLNGIPFFYLLGFRAEAGELVKPTVIQNRFSPSREGICGFHLLQNERYRMRVIEWCEPPPTLTLPLVDVGCKFDQTHLELEGSSNLVVGRYDVMEFTFSTRQPGYSEIALCAKPLKSADISMVNGEQKTGHQQYAWLSWPNIFVARVPVFVKTKLLKVLISALGILMGLILYLYVAPDLTGRWKSAIDLAGLTLLAISYKPIASYVEEVLKLKTSLGKLWQE
jgi:hypothetical protein